MPMSFCYLFEAKSIQKYILEAGRLADLIGASDLIAELALSGGGDLLHEVLLASENTDLETSFARRAGGSFCVLSDDPAKLGRLRALWRLVIMQMAPGLQFSDIDLVSGDSEMEAIRAAYANLTGIRENSAAMLLPAGGPMTAFNPRSGRLAVHHRTKGGDDVWYDSVTLPQRTHGKYLIEKAEEYGTTDRLATMFQPKDADGSYLFPRHFETGEATLKNPAFPFGKRDAETGSAGDSRVAVIHADVSGLGQFYRKVTNLATSAKDVFDVATEIETAITRAAQKASENCLLPFAAENGDKGFAELFGPKCKTPPKDKKIVPARPVLLGGDDITIITRADLAIRFTQELLIGIENETAAAFAKMSLPDDMKHGLTACAGIAIVGSGHPFLIAQSMAEGMCKIAKRVAKAGASPYPAMIEFAVITSTVDEDFADDYRKREQMTFDGAKLFGGPYLIGSGTENATRLDDLLALATAISDAEGYGKLIEALGLRHEGQRTAGIVWKRFWKVLDGDQEKSKAVRTALAACMVNDAVTEPDFLPCLDAALPILSDALELADIGAIVVEAQRS